MSFRDLIDIAIFEDLGLEGDVSSSAIFDKQQSKADLVCKSGGVLSGTGLVREVLERFGNSESVEFLVADGQTMAPGQLVAKFSGRTAGLLGAERIILNFLGFLSGIATETRKIVDILAAHGSTMKVLDTRKTLPGLRMASKQAVLDGGGSNHRMGLYDMVMLKDNHIDAAGGIPAAVQAVRTRWGSRFRIEVECRTINDVMQALDLDVDVIMLDNMGPETCRQAVEVRRASGKAIPFEVSGNLSALTIAGYASLGLEYASFGRITHSVQSVDFSLRIDKGGLG